MNDLTQTRKAMKTNPFGKLVCLGTLFVITLSFGFSAAHATSVRCEVKVAGYSSAGWILVVPELRSVLGGRVQYRSEYGRYVTDRVARGEPVRFTVSPSTSSEALPSIATVIFFSLDTSKYAQNWQNVTLPFVTTTTVPQDPAFSHAFLYVYVPYRIDETPIPIGAR
jgi:hypothetical protein